MDFSSTISHGILKRIVLPLLLLCPIIKGWAQNDISNYHPFFGESRYANEKVLVIRKLERNNQNYYLTVNPKTLVTALIPAKKLNVIAIPFQKLLENNATTPYGQALLAAQKQSFSIEDAGITHGAGNEKGITLTIDLCPSHKPLDRIIFTSLIAEFKKIEQPVPIGISITGRFLLTHAEDIRWLEELAKKEEISITWINHTYNHRYNPKTPLSQNFLLEPHTDINFEILGTEMALLQRGQTISPFFRFPGLVSDHELINKVTEFGLIPIGSDAWLAKGQPVHSGSIILIHGNGNEPLGVKDFIRLLQTKDAAVMKKEWLLYDLRESVENEFQE